MLLPVTRFSSLVPGGAAGYFSIESLDIHCGFEICLDHSEGFVRSTLAGDLLNFHFVSSAYVNHPSFNMVNVKPNGGYLVHASSDASLSGVFAPSDLRNRLPFQMLTKENMAGTLICTEVETS